jgi:hypothetical protein
MIQVKKQKSCLVNKQYIIINFHHNNRSIDSNGKIKNKLIIIKQQPLSYFIEESRKLNEKKKNIFFIIIMT